MSQESAPAPHAEHGGSQPLPCPPSLSFSQYWAPAHCWATPGPRESEMDEAQALFSGNSVYPGKQTQNNETALWELPRQRTQTGARAWVVSERGVVVPPYPWLCCLQLQLPALSWSPKILKGKFQKQMIPKLSTVHCSEWRDGASPCPALSSRACVIPLSGVSTL